MPRFTTISELRDFEIDGVPHGAFAASQLVDDTRDGYPDLGRYAREYKTLLGQSICLYDFSVELLRDIRPGHIYVWNGRRPSDGPVIAAARKLGIAFTTHIWDYDEPWEFGRGFIAIGGTTFHDLNTIRDVVRLKQPELPLSEDQEKQAIQYIESVTSFGRKLYRADERTKSLDFLLPGKRKIGIFTTSEWEFAGEPTWENRLYPTQWDGIRRIITDRALSPDAQIIVRLHPNLVNSPRNSGEWETIRRVQDGADSRTHFVQPDDLVDSYRLIQSCDVVVTFGSTVAVEAAWRGKPVVLLGSAHYEGAGFCYEPGSHGDAIDLLNSDLDPMPKSRVVRYAFLRLTSVWRRIELKHLWLDEHNRVRLGSQLLSSPSLRARVRSLAGRFLRKISNVFR